MIANGIETITVRGFKSIAAIEKLELRPINILIGANGSGKSNFLGVFGLLRAVRDLSLETYVGAAGGADRILHFGQRVTKELCFRFMFANREEYSVKILPTNDDRLFLSEGKSDGSSGIVSFTQIGASSRPILESASEHIMDALDRWRIYHVHDTSSSSRMRKTAKVHDNHELRSDVANLSAFLYLLQEKHRDSFELIQRTVQLVAPFFDSFQLQPLQLNPDNIKLEWRHVGSDAYFDASSLSDGTLRFIALATLFLQPKSFRPALILVDEPELGLHPYAIEILASLIRQASVDTQVIVSTQSSLLLDHFQPEDVLVAERLNGGTTIKRLDSERLAKWLEDYSLGQLWEKNEIGGRPSKE